MAESAPPFLHRWWSFIRERFPLGPHALMIGAFCVGNLAAVTVAFWHRPRLPAALIVTAVVALAFFRLRVFDELKDLDTDRALNPGRPLARGIIAPGETKRVAFTVAAVEGVLAAVCGVAPLMAWLVILVYSLLMYREFFLGAWLRRRMELYALTHTLVVAALTYFIAAGIRYGRWPVSPGKYALCWWCIFSLAVGNWGVFNVYEFARKSFAPEEERAGVESYSSRLGPWGATALTLANVVLASVTPAVLFVSDGMLLAAAVTVAGYVTYGLFFAVPYVRQPNVRRAVCFRRGMAALIVLHYVMLVSVFMWVPV